MQHHRHMDNPVHVYQLRDLGAQAITSGFDLVRLENRKSTLPYPHRHDYYQIVWVKRGSGVHIVDSIPYAIKKNSIFFLTPRQIHDFQLSDVMTGFTLNFSAEFFFGHSEPVTSTNFIFLSAENPIQVLYPSPVEAAGLQRDIDAIEEEYLGMLPRHHEVIRSYLHAFMHKTQRFAKFDETTPVAHRSFYLAQKFKMLLESEPMAIGPIRRYAAKLHVTERYLSEATKMATGLTPTELIHHRMVLEGKRLLAHSGLSITAVATNLGFEDPAYFSRFFRKYVGQSPSEFKQQTVPSVV